MNIKKELLALRSLLNLSQEDLANFLGVTFETINCWEHDDVEVEDEYIEKIYSFACKRKVYLNKIYEQLFKEEENENIKILFHGCRTTFNMPLDLKHSKANNDFSIGFYLGENLEQSSIYISNSLANKVYAFKLDLNNLRVHKFGVTVEWMLSIAYYRGWLNDFKDNHYLKNIIKDVEESDVIIAPIADNKMFDLVSDFVRGNITDMQCKHSLAATNLGMQYVLRTQKSLNQTNLISTFHICSQEKQHLILDRLDLNDLNRQKVQLAKKEYREKGKYIEEVLI